MPEYTESPAMYLSGELRSSPHRFVWSKILLSVRSIWPRMCSVPLINEVLSLVVGALLPIRLDRPQIEDRCSYSFVRFFVILLFAFCIMADWIACISENYNRWQLAKLLFLLHLEETTNVSTSYSNVPTYGIGTSKSNEMLLRDYCVQTTLCSSWPLTVFSLSTCTSPSSYSWFELGPQSAPACTVAATPRQRHQCADDSLFLFLCPQRAPASMANNDSGDDSAKPHFPSASLVAVTTWRLMAIRASKLSNCAAVSGSAKSPQ